MLEHWIETRRFAKGEKLETTVVGVSSDVVFIDINAKTEGIVDACEFANEDGSLSVKEGDKVTVFFLGESEEGLKFTAKFNALDIDAQALESAWANHAPVEGVVEKEIKGGFEVRLGKERAFCPHSQIGVRTNRGEKGGESPIGKRLTFFITEFLDSGKSIVVSHRAWFEEERKKKLFEFQSALKKGDRVKGTVASIHPFGMFIDIFGFSALVPISEISFRKLKGENEIRKLFPEGAEVEAAVLNSSIENGKISVSIKALEENPWAGALQKYSPGKRVSGKISKTADFGIFVKLEEGVEGLVHISELEKAAFVRGGKTNIKKAFKVGDVFNCEVLSVDENSKRIALAPAESTEQLEAVAQYLKGEPEGETYRAFASLKRSR